MTRSYLGQGQGHRGLKAAKMADLKSLLLYLFEVSVHRLCCHMVSARLSGTIWYCIKRFNLSSSVFWCLVAVVFCYVKLLPSSSTYYIM